MGTSFSFCSLGKGSPHFRSDVYTSHRLRFLLRSAILAQRTEQQRCPKIDHLFSMDAGFFSPPAFPALLHATYLHWSLFVTPLFGSPTPHHHHIAILLPCSIVQSLFPFPPRERFGAICGHTIFFDRRDPRELAKLAERHGRRSYPRR